MSDAEPADGTGEPTTAGERLRAAREEQGLSLDEVGARTRVPLRHLAAIETGDYQALPSPTYAVGFARAYARAVGLPDAQVAGQVRTEVNRIGPRQPEYQPYEMADPARVPSRGLAVVALGLALAVMILGGPWFASTRFARVGGDAEPTPAEAVVASAPATRAAPPRPTGGQVALTATDEVWLRVYDAADKTLFIGNMKAGDRFDVPADANDPKINVGRPDKLQVSLNGSNVPPLGDGSRPIKDVRVSGEAIARRLSGAPASGPDAAPAAAASPTLATGTPTPAATASRDVPPAFRAPSSGGASRPAAPTRALTETQRANLQSAARIRAQARER